MTRHFIGSIKSTNVRLFIAATTAMLVTGCGTAVPRSGNLQSYRLAGPAVCESFGPEKRCSHPDSSRVTRELERFNRSGQLGFRGW